MYKCKIWDKQSDIKGFNKEYWFDLLKLEDTDNVILTEFDGVVCYAEKESILRESSKYLDKTLDEISLDLEGSYNNPVMKNTVNTLNNDDITTALKQVLKGDMQSLAYILYPEDFTNTITK